MRWRRRMLRRQRKAAAKRRPISLARGCEIIKRHMDAWLRNFGNAYSPVFPESEIDWREIR